MFLGRHPSCLSLMSAFLMRLEFFGCGTCLLAQRKIKCLDIVEEHASSSHRTRMASRAYGRCTMCLLPRSRVGKQCAAACFWRLLDLNLLQKKTRTGTRIGVLAFLPSFFGTGLPPFRTLASPEPLTHWIFPHERDKPQVVGAAMSFDKTDNASLAPSLSTSSFTMNACRTLRDLLLCLQLGTSKDASYLRCWRRPGVGNMENLACETSPPEHCSNDNPQACFSECVSSKFRVGACRWYPPSLRRSDTHRQLPEKQWKWPWAWLHTCDMVYLRDSVQ